MSGSDSTDLLDVIERVLDRQENIDPLFAMAQALRSRADPWKPRANLEKVAFGLDTNIVLKMGNNDRRTVNLRDYLGTTHQGPLIVPGQVVQEFWNNVVSVVDTVSRSIKGKYEPLQKELEKANIPNIFLERFKELMTNFEEEYGYLYDPKTVERFSELFDMLTVKGSVPFVPRNRFGRLVEVRASTNTPPGFKDKGNGDFFVWADFLLGLAHERELGDDFEHVVLITEDVKADWSSGGDAHPILVAEVKSIVNCSFETWTLDRVNQHF